MFERLDTSISSYSKEQKDKIIDACKFAEECHSGQKRASGEDFVIHPIAVAINLANMNVDVEMVIAGLLHDVVEDTKISLDDISKKYGEKVAKLVDGVTKISRLKPTSESKSEIKAETIRKMLFAMINDVNVMVIKLADKMHNMETLNFLAFDKRKRIAFETLEMYAPLAGKIGMHFIKDRLEDLALKWIYPDVYETINNYFLRTEKDRDRTVTLIKRKLSEKLEENKIPFTIKARTKHYYSIYKKMKKYNKHIDEIFDLNGVRVITDNLTNCYQIFGIIHSLWQPIPSRFRDFIANPKKNGYRSLHTTVIFEKRKAVEIQIRTEEMNEFNEYGVAAHWYYKKGHKPSLEQLKWLSKLKEVHKEELSPKEYYKTLRDDILKDEIYVFTPKGDTVELPKDSTPVDFAYKIHTEVGHRCKGAIVNGMISPLNRPLKNGMVIEVITGKVSNPKRSWLSFVRTSHARKKIRSWLASNEAILDSHEKVKKEKKGHDDTLKKSDAPKKRPRKHKSGSGKVKISINGEKNLLYKFAKCCNPSPKDQIIGFVSRGRGIIIHKHDCYNLKYIQDIEKRLIKIDWVFE
jgi:GTP pyrophosphokinase